MHCAHQNTCGTATDIIAADPLGEYELVERGQLLLLLPILPTGVRRPRLGVHSDQSGTLQMGLVSSVVVKVESAAQRHQVTLRARTTVTKVYSIVNTYVIINTLLIFIPVDFIF